MLQVACIPYIIGWIITIFSSSVWVVYLSRLIVGASHALLTTSVYAVEITSKEMRARISFFEGLLPENELRALPSDHMLHFTLECTEYITLWRQLSVEVLHTVQYTKY